MATNTTTPSTVVEDSPYGYTPTFAAGLVFLSLFGLSTLLHIGQAIRYKMWWIFPTIIMGGCGELVGWTGRTWSSKSPYLRTPFLMQITTTIIAPTFILTANFIIVGKLIVRLGPQYSRLKPRLYTIVFCTCDVVALFVQAAGGGIASSADDDKGSALGANIMLGGIVFQLVAITVYSTLTSEFIFRFMYNRPFDGRHESLESRQVSLDAKAQLMLVGLGLSTLCMFVRAIYRTIELSGGWNGRIITTERYFLVLDAGMVVIALFALNLFHPGRLINKPSPQEKQSDAFQMPLAPSMM